MKQFLFILVFAQAINVYAVAKDQKATRKVASDSCLSLSTKTAVESEEQLVNDRKTKVNATDQRLLGHGAGTYLYSIFVDSPKTADNTHYEIVGELNFDDGSCKVVYSKRFEAP